MRRSDFIRGAALLGLMGASARAETLPKSTDTSAGRIATAQSGNTGAALYPSTYFRTDTIEGIPIFYREAGRPGAPVVLLLHGWPSSSRMYRNLIPLLADKYHVIAPDYPGFGHSGVPPRDTYDYSFDRAAAIVDALPQKLQINTFALYVSDIGAAIGYRLMVKKPGRMTALVAQNAPAYQSRIAFFKVLSHYWKDGSSQSPTKRSRLSRARRN